MTAFAQVPTITAVLNSQRCGGGLTSHRYVSVPLQTVLITSSRGVQRRVAYFRPPAKPSQYLIAWGTGLGAAVGFDATPPAALDFVSQGFDVKVIIGGLEIAPVYAGRSNVFPGLDNVIFQVPASLPAGCGVPFEVRVAGHRSNLTTIAIAGNANPAMCDSQFTLDALARLDSGGTVTAGFSI